jgi:hypothetical protein
MSHRSENGTKVFSVLGKIPETFPGKRAFFGGIFPGCFLDGKIPGSIPGKMPRFQSATVVQRYSDTEVAEGLGAFERLKQNAALAP